jgi:hypothetical protein
MPPTYLEFEVLEYFWKVRRSNVTMHPWSRSLVTRTLPLQNALHKASKSLGIEQDTLGHHLTL